MILSCQRTNPGILSEKYPYNYCNTEQTWGKNKKCGFLIPTLSVPRHIQKGREVWSGVSDLAVSQPSPKVIPDLLLVPDAFSVTWISNEL